jgi:outer membrane protein
MIVKQAAVASAMLAGLLTSHFAFAQNLKVGYVNVVKIIEQAPQGDAALKKLESEFGPRDRELRGMRDQIKNLEEDLDKNALVLKEAERRDKERELLDLRRSLKRSTQEFREDYNLRRNEELSELQKIVYKAIVDIAKADKFDLIIHEGAVYASDRIDITEQVLKQLTSN